MGGFQMLLAGDIQRAKFRNNPSKPEPLVPGEVTTLAFSIGDKYHTFRKGHRVMVQIQSSWFPMFDRNPQTFVDIYHAKPSDYQRGDAPRVPLAAAAVVRDCPRDSPRRFVEQRSPGGPTRSPVVMPC